jgi:hypothetical protein
MLTAATEARGQHFVETGTPWPRLANFTGPKPGMDDAVRQSRRRITSFTNDTVATSTSDHSH